MTTYDRIEAIRQQPGVCETCKQAVFDGGCPVCKGTGQQPAQPVIGSVADMDQRAAEIAAANPMPAQPESGEVLARFGLQWNGPREFVCTPMPDGYWTPWHIAHEVLTAAQQRIRELERGSDEEH